LGEMTESLIAGRADLKVGSRTADSASSVALTVKVR
jgi:hypothetical protein